MKKDFRQFTVDDWYAFLKSEDNYFDIHDEYARLTTHRMRPRLSTSEENRLYACARLIIEAREAA